MALYLHTAMHMHTFPGAVGGIITLYTFLACIIIVLATQPEKLYLQNEHMTCTVMTHLEGLRSDNPAPATFYHIAFNENNQQTILAKKTPRDIGTNFHPSQRVIYACCDGCDTVQIQHTPEQQSTRTNVNANSVAKFLWKQDASELTQSRTIPATTTATCLKKLQGHRADCDCSAAGVQENYDIYIADTGGCSIGTYWGGCIPSASLGSCIPCTSALEETSEYTSAGDLGRDNCDFQCKPGHYYAQNDPTVQSNLCTPCTVCPVGYYIDTPCSQTIDISRESDLDTQCIPCPPGQSSDGNNAASCQHCGYGFQSTDFGSPCVPCQPWQYTTTLTATQCLECEPGFVANPSKSGCSPCPRGSYRTTNMRECTPCPIGTAQNDTGQISCQTCVGAVALIPGSTECGSCPPDKLPNPIRINTDGSLQQGGVQCLDCSRLGVPSDESTIDWLGNCQWQCREGYYRDFYANDCRSCNVPCTGGPGLYRPYCTTGTLGLPPCLACTNSPAPGTSVPGVALQYTGNTIAANAIDTPSCPFECLPGHHTANCIPCDPIPDTAIFTAGCAWKCPTGQRDVAGTSCQQCDYIPHPRTLQEAATFPDYFGRNFIWVDFAVCNDNENKEYGVQFPYVAGVTPSRCGNGVLELQTEECDDANTRDADGCSSTCMLEPNYHDCSQIGQPCTPNCSFPWTTTSNLPSLRGYYLTDATCSTGTRDLSSRRACGLPCPGRPTVHVDECTPANKGCLSCNSDHYADRNTGQCIRCGSVCQIGFYPVPTCDHTRDQEDQEQQENSQAARGCAPCTAPDLAAVVWTSAGITQGDDVSCRFTCNTNYYCDGTIDPIDNTCTAGTCTPCAPLTSLTCAAGTFPTACTLAGDAQCSPCASKPEGSQWDPTATGYCKFKCDADTKWLPELQLCDPCTFPKTCPAGYRTKLCDDSVPDNVDALNDPQYCAICNPVTDTGMEAVASTSGRCEKDCILQKFFSPDLNTTSCMECAKASTCRPGTRYVPCTRRQDTQCQPCPANDPSTSFLEYYTPTAQVPNCQMRCIQNYAWDNEYKTCRPCAQRCSTQPGMRPEHQCLGIGERSSLPQCVPCNDQTTLIPANAHYTNKCEWACDNLYYRTTESGLPICKQCQACPLAAYPNPPYVCSSVNPRLQCTVCTNIPQHANAISNTDPTCPFTCHIGYYKQWIDNGATLSCTPRWSVQQFLLNNNAVAMTTPQPQSTPPPQQARAIITVDNRPIRFQSSQAAKNMCYQHTIIMLLPVLHILFLMYQTCF